MLSQLFGGASNVPAKNAPQVFGLIKDAILFNNYRKNQHEDHEGCLPSLLEAYTILNSCLKTREGATEVAGEARKVIQAIKRDFLTLKNTTDVLEVRNIVQIYRVLDAMFSAEPIASVIEAEYVRFFLGSAIDILASPDASKALTGACIRLFTNLYYPKALSSDMAARLLKAIGTRPTFPSATLAIEYLTAYRMMLVHHRNLMATSAVLWVATIVNLLCDSNALVRQHALHTLTECNRKLSCERSISSAIFDAFDATDADGEPCGNVICQRLSVFVTLQGESRTTMSIWSNVLLALHSNSGDKLVEWPFMVKWIDICKQALHSAFLSTREAALIAWRTAIYVLAFDTKPQQYDRCLQFLIYPLRIVRDNVPAVILKRQLGILNALLYIGLRIQPVTPELYDLVWTNVVAPVMQYLFASGCSEAQTEAIKVLNGIIRSGQLQTPGSKPQRAKIIGSDVELSEIGGFPTWWIKQNLSLVLELVLDIRESAGTDVVMGLWQSIAAVCKQSLASEIHESNDSVNMVASMLTFIQKVPEPNVVDFAMPMIDTIGVASMLSRRFALGDDNVVAVAKSHANSAISIILGRIFAVVDEKPAEQALVQILNKTGTLRRALSLLSTAVNIAPTGQVWKTCAQQTSNQLTSEPCTLEGDDLDNVLAILSVGPERGLDKEAWEKWLELFSATLKAHGKNEPFVTLMGRYDANQLDLQTLLDLKAGPLCNRNDFNVVIVRALSLRAHDLIALEPNLSGIASSFRVQLARQLVTATYNVQNDFFPQVLDFADKLVEDTDIIANADIFAMGFQSSLDEHKQHTADKWNSLFANVPIEAEFSDKVVATINHVHSGQIADIVIPPSIPLLSSSLGSETPSRKRLAFPSSSPPQSPTEDLARFKKRRTAADGYDSHTLATPPNSSDSFTPGMHAMDLFRRLHETSDPFEIVTIKEEHSQMAKPRPIPLLSEMENLCSSPPRSMAQDDMRERSKELGILKSALMRSDLRRNLKKGVSKSECQLLEKLLMDTLVAVRIHMANTAE